MPLRGPEVNWPPKYLETERLPNVYKCTVCHALIDTYDTNDHTEWHEELHALIQLAGQGISLTFTEEETK